MKFEQASELLKKVGEQIEPQAKAIGAFGGLNKDLFSEERGKEGAAVAATDIYGKIGNVNPKYSMELATQLVALKEKLIKLYEQASKFTPKKVREAFYAVIAKTVAEPIAKAIKTYNLRVQTPAFKEEAARVVKGYQNVMYGI